MCERFVASIREDTTADELGEIVYEAANRWANAGLTHLEAHRALQDGLRAVIEQLSAQPTTALLRQLRMIVAAAAGLPRSVLRAYYPWLQTYFAAPPATDRALACSVLGIGAAPLDAGTAATEVRTTTADTYEVVAVQLAPVAAAPARVAPMRRLLRELRARRGAVLSIAAESGGTVLIPAAAYEPEHHLDQVLGSAAAAADLTFTAAAVRAPVPELPAARRHAHELLDLVEQLDLGPGLYRFADLALEHQLAQDGSAREAIAAVLDPLEAEPELLATLAQHIGSGGIRTQTAQALGLHLATVTRRMRRIHELTGLEPTDVFGLWRLRAALLARTTRAIQPERDAPARPLPPGGRVK